MAVSKRGARIVAAALFGLMLLFVFAPTALAAVYWGQSGETVRRVQQKLKQWGYYSGAVDGVFGQGTYDAVSDGQINLAPSEQSRRAARDALNGWDPTSGCLYYYNPATATSPWIWSREVRLTIGDHSFAV